ncbi:hypothetical protein A1O7_05807 [Cladophialophora yegresii CBS 114405]|uniref:Uncharacterized protein n=1 Tax=Cladophialophora yegresii CBS 114405 TaxID=1182544 RepID=W9VRR1_9EURO|nr:uncharacterized protein A1O7_05807 [Cladophialophora yegresii CBS 114405]EXJ58382.1 hypothetical protein A1O7_05807 [Cladophialophora yegresii CBS 114405]
MPVKYSDPSDDSSASRSSRLVHRVSNSVGSFRVRKHTRLKTEDESDLSEIRSPPRYSTRSFRDSRGLNPGSLRRHRDLNTDGGRDIRSRHPEKTSSVGTNPFRRTHQSHNLETVLEVPSSQASQRTTIFNDSQSQQELAKGPGGQSTSVERLHAQHSSACSDMHQSVKSDDYLLARGANPRTGVVTPAHSASSSLDDHTAKSQAPRRPARWRQKSDQWISLDLGEPTPISTAPLDRLPEHQHQALRIPQKLVAAKPADSIRESRLIESRDIPLSSPGPKVTFHANERLIESSVSLDEKIDAHGHTVVQQSSRLKPPVKRKPVGSPPNRSLAERATHTQEGSDESTDTVLRTPRLNDVLSSSSAPDALRGRFLNPKNVDKDLPKVPYDSALHETQHATSSDPFLGARGTGQPANVPSSEISSISGPQMAEKELPCLLMNNGPSQSTRNSPPYPTSPTKTTADLEERHHRAKPEAPQGPRVGGNPAYPYIRTERPTYPITPAAGSQHLIGKRTMPVPVYDNPPKHPSPFVRTTRPRVEGPRSMPPQEMSVLEKTRLALNPLLNTTTTPTGTFINGAGLPGPLQVGPRPTKPDLHMHRGHHGFLRRPAPPSGSDIIMNTTMNISPDCMMSIPMPRIRPRAMARPAMPTRAEGMYGIPKVESRGRWDPTRRDHQSQRMLTPIDTVSTPGVTDPEPVSMPEVLRPPVEPCRVLPFESETLPEQEEVRSTSCGLMRKCSRCIHGFVDVKLHTTDSVIHTSDPQKDVPEAKDGTKPLRPYRSPLPVLPEDSTLSKDAIAQQGATTASHGKAESDERDHSICCPQCCKLDCHEGCLGHPSPTSSPSPVNSMWSGAQTPSSSSDVSTLVTGIDAYGEAKTEKPEQSTKTKGSDFVKAPRKLPPKMAQASKPHGKHIQAALSGPPFGPSVQTPTPPTPAKLEVLRPQAHAIAAASNALKPPAPAKPSEAVPAARSAIAFTQQKGTLARPNIHRRQRSNSLPIFGLGITSRKSSGCAESNRAVSGSRLRIPSPMDLALGCSATKTDFFRSRNVSGTSINTIEVQIPNLASYTALYELIFVPIEATTIWVKTHPQMLTIGGDMLRRAWEMAQIMTKTAWSVWAVIFVYSKTGREKRLGDS